MSDTAVDSLIRVLRISVAVVLLGVFTYCLKPRERLPYSPIIEDGFYSLSVARNIALGHGLTTDGVRLQLTNGFQPLFTFISAIPYLATGADHYSALRGILLLHTLVFAAAALCFGMLTSRLIPADLSQHRTMAMWLTALLYLCSHSLREHHHNGLETGLSLLLFACVMLVWIKWDSESLSQTVLLGFLLGLLALTRVDNIIYVIVLCIGSFWALRNRSFRQRVSEFMLLAVTSFLVVLPWLSYNYWLTGSIVPSSGLQGMQLELTGERISKALFALSDSLLPLFDLIFFDNTFPVGSILVRLVLWLVCLTGVVLAARSIIPAREQASAARHLKVIMVIHSVFAGLLLVWYSVNCGATWFYPRYFAAFAVLSIVPTGLGLTLLIVYLQKQRKHAVWLIYALIILLAAHPIRAMHLHHAAEFASFHGVSPQLELVRAHVPPNSNVGATQSGTLGYFRDNVVNLDGKTNHQVLGLWGRTPAITNYLKNADVNWLCDVEGWIAGVLGASPRQLGWQRIDSRWSQKFKRPFVLYRYQP